jgi:UDP-2,3-diacylglucosamine pyrophosphatase LpxH
MRFKLLLFVRDIINLVLTFMRHLVTSDLHLGSRFSHCQLFSQMLKRLDPSVTLVLDGDIIDAPGQTLPFEHQQVLEEIAERASQSRVIWIEGNHDRNFRPEEPTRINFVQSYTIEDHTFITHGDTFDKVMPRNRMFIKLFLFFHKLRVFLGAHPIHVADYAKKFTFLYSFLRRKVMLCAVDHGKQQNLQTVVCGHVHYAEDTHCEGIRYINLGAWTESNCMCLLVEDERLELISVEDAMRNPRWFTDS